VRGGDGLRAGGEQPVTACTSLGHVLEIVEHACGFLRIHGSGMYTESSSKLKHRGVEASVLFYIKGLPSAKRAKWVLPLLWSVASILQRRGWPAVVKGGKLYMPIRTGMLARIDFAAARH